MKILGLDISSVSTGWAILETPLKLIDYGIIACESKWSSGQKLYHFDTLLTGLLEHHPDIEWVGIEDVYNNNTNTIKVLSRFNGVATKCIYSVLDIGLVYTEEKIGAAKKGMLLITPSAVNKSIGLEHRLERNERKQKISEKVHEILKLKHHIDEDDITDAIAVGLATINKIKG